MLLLLFSRCPFELGLDDHVFLFKFPLLLLLFHRIATVFAVRQL
jgi:hypothetical protein